MTTAEWTGAIATCLGLLLSYRIMRASKRRVALETTPQVVLINDPTFSYKNVGKGTALNVQIDELTLNLVSVLFRPLSLLEPGRADKVEYKVTSRNRETEGMRKGFGDIAEKGFQPPFFSAMQVHKYTLTIHYENVERKRFGSEIFVDVDNKEIRLQKAGKAKPRILAR